MIYHLANITLAILLVFYFITNYRLIKKNEIIVNKKRNSLFLFFIIAIVTLLFILFGNKFKIYHFENMILVGRLTAITLFIFWFISNYKKIRQVY